MIEEEDKERRFQSWRYCLESPGCRVWKYDSTFFGATTTLCSKSNQEDKYCIPSEWNSCTNFDSNNTQFLLWSSTWGYKSFSILPNMNLTHEQHGLDALDICHYPLIASANLDKFTIKVGHEFSRAQYTLFVKTFTDEYRSLSNTYMGTLEAISKNHKEFYLLVLPMGDYTSIKFTIQSGDKSLDVAQEKSVFLGFLMFFLILWLIVIAVWVTYIFVVKGRFGYMNQVDQDTFEDTESNLTPSAREISPSCFNTEGGFGKSLMNKHQVFQIKIYLMLKFYNHSYWKRKSKIQQK